MEIERFFGGVLYRAAIDSKRALKAARVSRALLRYDESLFFKPPMNNVLGVKSRVKKAWIQYPEGEQTSPSIANDYSDCEGAGEVKH